MVFRHIWGLLTHPEKEWKAIRKENCGIGRCYCTHVLILAAIPPVSGFIGTTRIGWQIGGGEVVKLTTQSAGTISILYYLAILVGIFSVGKMIHWMAQTYGAKVSLPLCIGLAAYTATPLLLIGLMGLYPVLWLNFIIALPALAYTVYLLYTGVPVMMGVSKEKGFLFASAVLAVGMVMLVALLAATVILWGAGIAPVFTS
ncbi:MAG: Yip1 family protein [Gammaproteobacteria bacterium]|nr:MAG: Yip1 family protein [Gammaproteobacteria bacterium]